MVKRIVFKDLHNSISGCKYLWVFRYLQNLYISVEGCPLLGFIAYLFRYQCIKTIPCTSSMILRNHEIKIWSGVTILSLFYVHMWMLVDCLNTYFIFLLSFQISNCFISIFSLSDSLGMLFLFVCSNWFNIWSSLVSSTCMVIKIKNETVLLLFIYLIVLRMSYHIRLVYLMSVKIDRIHHLLSFSNKL